MYPRRNKCSNKKALKSIATIVEPEKALPSLVPDPVRQPPFYSNAPSNCSSTISAAYVKHEKEKKREYGQRVRDVECGVFTPLVFSTTGGMSRECTVFYKWLASLLSEKNHMTYCTVMGWLRCRLSFSVLRSSIMCIRGSRSSYHRPMSSHHYSDEMHLASSEAKVPDF